MTRIEGIVTEITALTERISAFRIAAADGGSLPPFDAGAHIEIDLPQGARSYSLIRFDANTAPCDTYLIAVQREDEGKGGSRAMHDLKPGDSVTFAAPKCDFPVTTQAPALLLAGGIGVTPLISMAAALRQAGQEMRMVFAGRAKDQMAYLEPLSQLLGDAFSTHFDETDGVLDVPALVRALGDAHLYVCGPRGMIDAARRSAEEAGIPQERIHFELFEAASAEAGDSAFEVQINDGSVFTIPPGKSIIEVLEENDVDVMYDCQRGDCGICQCDVLDGVPDHRDVVLSETERAAGDVMQICVSRAKTARLVLDI